MLRVAPLLLAPLLVAAWLSFSMDIPWATPEADLHGIWERVEHKGSNRVRFYYFHNDGSGLFRFGTSALNHTQMFDQKVSWRGLELTFRKTGRKVTTPFKVVTDPKGGRWLQLDKDPLRDGKTTRYRRRADPGQTIGPSTKDPFARMWMHRRKLRGGGTDFRIYQFRPAQRNGHGTGWYHEGDFDEWTTESLHYHRGPKSLHLIFDQRGEKAFTPMEMRNHKLHLRYDPRYFGRSSAYDDSGPNLMITTGLEP